MPWLCPLPKPPFALRNRERFRARSTQRTLWRFRRGGSRLRDTRHRVIDGWVGKRSDSAWSKRLRIQAGRLSTVDRLSDPRIGCSGPESVPTGQQRCVEALGLRGDLEIYSRMRTASMPWREHWQILIVTISPAWRWNESASRCDVPSGTDHGRTALQHILRTSTSPSVGKVHEA